MRKTLQIINQLEKEGVIERYALGGATALLFYAEPALTFDVDVFIFLPGDRNSSRLIDLGPIYKTLEAKGYSAKKEHIMIEGIPVQFIPVYNELVKEAVEQATLKDYQGVKVRVVKIEYLMAIMMDTNRPKDRERITQLLGQVKWDKKLLHKILKSHLLQENWEREIEKN